MLPSITIIKKSKILIDKLTTIETLLLTELNEVQHCEVEIIKDEIEVKLFSDDFDKLVSRNNLMRLHCKNDKARYKDITFISWI